jgi:hypothetical protein
MVYSSSHTKSALIDPFSFLVVSSRRDVPPERLYKVRRVAEKGGIKPGFGIICMKYRAKNLTPQPRNPRKGRGSKISPLSYKERGWGRGQTSGCIGLM